jgi:hypothetical protein
MRGFISDALEVMGEISGGREREIGEKPKPARRECGVGSVRGIFPIWFLHQKKIMREEKRPWSHNIIFGL